MLEKPDGWTKWGMVLGHPCAAVMAYAITGFLGWVVLMSGGPLLGHTPFLLVAGPAALILAHASSAPVTLSFALVYIQYFVCTLAIVSLRPFEWTVRHPLLLRVIVPLHLVSTLVFYFSEYRRGLE